MAVETQTNTEFVTITDLALSQIKQVVEQQNNPELFLRLYVQGGCGGIAYGMALDVRKLEGDEEYLINGINVVVDRISKQYVEGSTVDFDNSGEKAGFRITNPNVDLLQAASCGSSCSCGAGGCGSGGCC